jgi:hypothetical protein
MINFQMKCISKVVGCIWLLAASVVAHANPSTYKFSYTFASSGVVYTGTLDGEANGDLVTGLSNISVCRNGVGFQGNGHLYGSSNDPAMWWIRGGATVSVSGAANN